MHSEFRSEGRLVLGIDNVGAGEFRPGNQNRISETKFEELRRFAVRAGDVLVTVMASLGRSCVVPDDLEPSIVTKHLYRVTTERDFVAPDFVNHVIQGSEIFRKAMFNDARGQTRPGLNSEILRSLPIPIAGIAEQREIAEVAEAALSELDHQRHTYGQFNKAMEALRQSILTAAYSWELAEPGQKHPAGVGLHVPHAGLPTDHLLRRTFREWHGERASVALGEVRQHS